MRLFRRRQDGASGATHPLPSSGSTDQEAGDGLADVLWWSQPIQVPEPEEEDLNQISVARTLVMSEPELSALLASDPRLQGEGLEIELVEKGFGTRVAISATPESGLGEADLEALLDDLAEPQKRPFSAS